MSRPEATGELAARLVRNEPGDTQLSDDGRLYWDGQQWLPVPWAAPAPHRPPATRPRRYSPLGIARLLIAAEALAFVLVGTLGGVPLLLWVWVLGNSAAPRDSTDTGSLGHALGLLGVVLLIGFVALVALAALLARPTARAAAIVLHALVAGLLVTVAISDHKTLALALAVLPGIVLWQLLARGWPSGRLKPIISR